MKSKSISQLATEYGVSPKTFKKWVAKIPDIESIKGRRLFTPAEIEKIFYHLGKP
jgi:transposase-like protein